MFSTFKEHRFYYKVNYLIKNGLGNDYIKKHFFCSLNNVYLITIKHSIKNTEVSAFSNGTEKTALCKAA